MKVLVIGGNGMLGHKLLQVFGQKFDVWTTVRNSADKLAKLGLINTDRIEDLISAEQIKKLEEIVRTIKPDFIVNAIGVIKQLPTAGDIIKVLAANAIFPHQMLEIAERNQAVLINVSTDCVFNGKKGNYTENDVSDATDVYGKSKWLGETISNSSITIRTSIIGRELDTSHSLVEWFLGNESKQVKGFRKAIFSGFPTLVLAEILAEIIEKHSHIRGLFHISSDPISKYDLLTLLNEAYRPGIEILPDDDFEIDRSLNSTKFRAQTGFEPASWREMVNRMAADNAVYKNK